ncbi:LpqB family beta-propeller domain-containing protein [Saccharopolyspora taberi]|uniref:LpqB family beta-propeller domain-containing protein n=1 Tax=Saccharopolyspora taberi TaxID=60895 RepID=A0ABN3VM66_9PSEU
MRARLVALFALFALVISGCASIPENSDPEAVRRVDESNTTMPVTAPPEGIDSFTLVRNFVNASAAPENDHLNGRLHLTEQAKRSWMPTSGLLVVDDVDTIPAASPEPLPEGVQLVSLQANRVGRLLADQSFVPEEGEYTAQVRVERQADGQWRIANPPPELVVSRASFESNYRQVPIYFFDHDWTGVVPDLRYVVAQPQATLPSRVVDLLMKGPSEGLRTSLGNAIPEQVQPKTNVTEAANGALEVNLSSLRGLSQESRRLIAAQIVLSLQSVSNARVQLSEEGSPLLEGGRDLWPTDFTSFETDNAGRPDLSGLAVASERLHVLDEQAEPVPGPAGSGELDVVRAAQSADGAEIAAVTRKPGGVGLRIGQYGGQLPELQLSGADMSRPSWRGEGELWTVVNRHDIVRLVEDGGTWVQKPVDARELGAGKEITDLRLSRDGARAAVVVDGRLVVAGVSDEDGRISLRRPTVLPIGGRDVRVTGVEWLGQQSLVAITDSNSQPVVEVTADGFRWTPYASVNLVQPLVGVAVGPGGNVVVAAQSGLWQAGDSRDVWTHLQTSLGGNSLPFFPG